MSKMEYFRKTISVFFEYDTPKIVHIKSKRIGITNRFLQILIISYIIGYAIVWKKGYQETCPVSSAVTTKVKGVVYTSLTKEELGVPANYSPLYDRVWDATDYTIPTSGGEYGGFFITTNVIITPNQTRGICPEDFKIEGALSTDNTDCPEGDSLPIGNGVFTGNCVKSSRGVNKTCEIHAWCPVELDDPPLHGKKALLEGSRNFTVLIKNVIEFPKFGPKFKRRNILENSNTSYLQRCIYNAENDPFCPVFRMGDIVEAAGENYSEVAIKGGVFEVEITWDCDLDWDFMEYCRPKYSFERMDSPQALISPGWNFRTAEYHEENRRTLFKNYGIKFLVKVTGSAGKFYLVPLLINLGSGLALLGLATIFCDILVLRYVIIHKKGYQLESPITYAVTTKVKCVIFTNFTIEELGLPPAHAYLYNRVFDPTDYVTPAAGGTNGDFFILTNMVITPNQVRGICPEAEELKDSRCSSDSDCPEGSSHPIGNGVYTGKCVETPMKTIKMCELKAWCPVELDQLPLGGRRALLEDVKSSTVLIKNSIEFPYFGPKYRRRNILESSSVHDLEKCINHAKDDPFCPIFKIGDIVEAAGENFSSVAVKGGVFRIEISWECDLDWDFAKHCKPRYSFERMDVAESEISPGWNFRSGKYHEENRRTLSKNYGIKFLVEVRGNARKFNIVPLLIHLSSCIALLKFSTILCDIVLLKMLSKRQFFRDNKFEVVSSGTKALNNDDDSPSTTENVGDTGNINHNHTTGHQVVTIAEKDSQLRKQ